ncbi:MAG: hypothetical protein DIU71_00925 [Proteobacteria bacterium]|nr:MAG: hypothetical protein DIU71_00925 [Pseudomonadota bacterium]
MHSIRLLQFTDSHLSGEAAARYRGVLAHEALARTVAQALRHFGRPDAFVLTGDLAHEDAGGYRWIREIFGAAGAPVLCIAGNHDLPEAMSSELGAPPFQIGGQLQMGRWLILLLDSRVPGEDGGRLGGAQLERLDAALQAHADKHVLLCLHHHPIAMHSRWLDTVGLEDAADFNAVIGRHDNVRGVLWGHVHQALDTFSGGVRFMSTPSTCVQFLPESAEFAMDQRPPGYRSLELMPDGSIATEVGWLAEDAARSVA